MVGDRMVSEQMAAYLKALKEKGEDLILIIDIDRRNRDGSPARMAARWDTKNLYHYRCDDMREILARMLLIACNGNVNTAIGLLFEYEAGALDWISSLVEEERQTELRKMEEYNRRVERDRELNRQDNNKPKVIQ